jgi:hypothetical protein
VRVRCGDDARRLRALPPLGTDELVGALVGVLFAGPDILPPGTDVLIAAREPCVSDAAAPSPNQRRADVGQ